MTNIHPHIRNSMASKHHGHWRITLGRLSDGERPIALIVRAQVDDETGNELCDVGRALSEEVHGSVSLGLNTAR